MDNYANSSSSNGDHDQPQVCNSNATVEPQHFAAGSKSLCNVADCDKVSAHSIRRKWFMRMKKSISKLLTLKLESGTAMLSICETHYDVISHLMVCAFCKRKLVRNHIYYISQVSFSFCLCFISVLPYTFYFYSIYPTMFTLNIYYDQLTYIV